MRKLSPEKRCLLALAIFTGVCLCVFIPCSVVFNLWGLTIGWAFGFFVASINMILLFKSGELIAKNALETNKGTGLSILFYFARFALIIGSFILCAILDFKVGVECFKYSIYTCAASLLPSIVIITILYRTSDITSEDKKA